MLKTPLPGGLLARTEPRSRLDDHDAHDERPLSFRATGHAFAVLAWGVFALTFLKGFRFPSLWCATHFTFNYSQGFVRRALVGEIARRIGGDNVYKYNVFLVFSFLVMAAVGVLFGFAIRRVLRAHSGDWVFRVTLLVACASPGMIFLVHAVGYFDFLGLLAVLCILTGARRRKGQFWAFYALSVVGLVLPLIHEGLAVMFGPSALFIGLCHWLRALHGHKPTRRDWCLLAGHLIGSLLLVFAVLYAVSGATDVARAHALEAYASNHADFRLRPDAFRVLSQTTRQNVLVVVPSFWRVPDERVAALRGQLAFLPGFLFVLYCGARELAASSETKSVRAALLLLFLLAGSAPELMNVAGWDWPRWNSMALMSALICIVAYKLYFPSGARARRSLRLITAGLLLTATGLASTAKLFDNYQVQFFPFDQQFEFINQVLESGFRYKPTDWAK